MNNHLVYLYKVIFLSKLCIVDFRMRKVEKEYIKSLGYKIIENGFNLNTYDEISSHPDIYYTKVNNAIFCEPNKKMEGINNIIIGGANVGKAYPDDILYNVLVMGNIAVHNFKYTDKNLYTYLKGAGYTLIQVEQGYTKCSACVVDNNSCIISDIGIAKELLDVGIDCIYVSEPDIKLLKRTNSIFITEDKMRFEYSKMQGFIGGAMARLGDTVIIFGDIAKLINGEKIKKFVEKKGLKLHWFEGLDVIDYGGIIEVEKVNE